MPLKLAGYPCETITNRHFRDFDLAKMERVFLPSSLQPLMDQPPTDRWDFIEDDNRSAIYPEPAATLDGQPFYLSVKGVGATIDPYSMRTLDALYAAELVEDPEVRRKLLRMPTEGPDRIITGELWLRGSPYGGQGLEHATTAMEISERAELTSINGFLIAPVVKICLFPERLQEQLRTIHWYRKYQGRMVQELRLVPSNVRVYFHAKNTVGNNIGHVFDMFGVQSNDQALRLCIRFVQTTIAMLTLFARTLTYDEAGDEYRGLDFHDVWLDKDAVLAPDGSVYFVDLEGIEEVAVEPSAVKEKIEDQVYRSLYELMFAYQQIENERTRRFGEHGNRKRQFEWVLEQALKDDPMVRLRFQGSNLEMEIRNKCNEESLYTRFPAVDR
ncbi:MAG: hypothetical protein L3K03_08835 [Thermoplasmata archaeon]|nr:hypothetical protein [Thermoplasmata archaeon]